MSSEVSKIRWFLIRGEFYGYCFSGLVLCLVGLITSLFMHGQHAVYVRWMAVFSLLLMCAIGILRAVWLFWKTRNLEEPGTD